MVNERLDVGEFARLAIRVYDLERTCGQLDGALRDILDVTTGFEGSSLDAETRLKLIDKIAADALRPVEPEST